VRPSIHHDASRLKVVHRLGRLLTMVTVLALPINLVSGLFGMNVGGVLFNQHPTGFWLVLS